MVQIWVVWACALLVRDYIRSVPWCRYEKFEHVLFLLGTEPVMLAKGLGARIARSAEIENSWDNNLMESCMTLDTVLKVVGSNLHACNIWFTSVWWEHGRPDLHMRFQCLHSVLFLIWWGEEWVSSEGGSGTAPQLSYTFHLVYLSPRLCPSTAGCSPPSMSSMHCPLSVAFLFHLSPGPCPSTAGCSPPLMPSIVLSVAFLFHLSPRLCPSTAGCSPPSMSSMHCPLSVAFLFHLSPGLCPSTAGCSPPSMSFNVLCLLLPVSPFTWALSIHCRM